MSARESWDPPGSRREAQVRGHGRDTYEIHVLVITCCGQEITCDRWTNTCDRCWTDYGSNGFALAPRSQWGAETGESLADIFGPGGDDD